MSATTIDPAITRLSNPALASDATAKPQIHGFIKATAFHVEISLEDSSAVNPVLDLTSAITEWKFTPADPDDYPDDDDVYLDEVGDEPTLDQDDEEGSDLDDALDSESDEDDEDDTPSELLGFLDLTFWLSKDTLIQSALLRESACINTAIIINDAAGAPLAKHTFMGFIYQEDILPIEGKCDAQGHMTASVRIRVFDCTLWSML